jgi:SAM-dependent methyltransferase
MIWTIATGAARAILHPVPRARKLAPLRAVVRLPGVFDLASLTMQAIDLARLPRIGSTYSVEGDYMRQVHDYNASVSLKKTITFTRRAEIHYEMLTGSPPRRVDGESLLVVGPRNRHELLMAWCHGYAWDRISAIDLYSTNPKIQVMNMEKMSFPAASFDAVAMAHTLAYSSDCDVAIGEVARVLRPGGRFAFGAAYEPVNDQWKGNRVPAQQLVDRMHDLDMEVVGHLAYDKTNGLGFRQTTHAFVARKRLDGESRLDPFRL